MKKIGRYWLGTTKEIYDIYVDEEEKEIYQVNTSSGKKKEANLSYITKILVNPWDKIHYLYDEEEKMHEYRSVLFEDVTISIFGETVEKLLNNLAVIFSISQKPKDTAEYNFAVINVEDIKPRKRLSVKR